MSEKEEIPPPTPDGHHPGAGDQAVGPASKEPEIIWHDDDDDDDDDPPMAPHRKEGRGCFLTLLIVSAIPVVFFLITFTGGDFLTYIYMRNWVTDHALVSRMPILYKPAQARSVVKTLDAFYDAGRKGKIPATEVISVSSEFKELLSYPGSIRPESLSDLVSHARAVMEQYHVADPGLPVGPSGK